MTYDAKRAADFFDDYGEREWNRFDDVRMGPASFDVHAHYLRRFIRRGGRVLDVGAGPGRFTIELGRIGAEVVVADLSPVQLDLNRDKVAKAGLEVCVVDRVLADVSDLSAFDDDSFDAAVCDGGPLSYVVERADRAAAELIRPELREALVRVELDLGAEASAIDCGEYLLAVVRKP